MLNKVDDLWVLNLAYEIIEKLTRKEGEDEWLHVRTKRTLCNGSIKFHSQKASVMPDSVDYLTGRKRHSGSSVDFQVNKGMGGGIVPLPYHIAEGRCLLWQRRNYQRE